MHGFRQALHSNTAVKVAEILLVFLVAVMIIAVGWSLVGDHQLARQGVVWVANVMMLLTIWAGLRLRGQSWAHFGLGFKFSGRRQLFYTFLKSLLVFIIALAAFMLGAIVAVNLVSDPIAKADMSSYEWLQGNLPMLLVALVAVYIVSSFGEEAIYRGFLINRIEELGKGRKFALASAVIISSVIFGLIHFGWGLAGVIQTTFMGFALALLYLRFKRNLWVLVLAHAYMDTLLFLQIYLSPVATAVTQS